MRILIADDHQLFIDGLRHILVKLDTVVEITESVRAEQAIEILESSQDFDLVLVDLKMPGMDGMSILQRMRERTVGLPLVIVSAEEDTHIIRSALEAGALGFIPKSHSSRQMLDALRSIMGGDIYIPEDIRRRIDSFASRRQALDVPSNDSRRTNGITKRQYEVLTLLAKGYSNRQIATSLYLTEHTVKAHISALFVALNADNRVDCVQKAKRRGLLA